MLPVTDSGHRDNGKILFLLHILALPFTCELLGVKANKILSS